MSFFRKTSNILIQRIRMDKINYYLLPFYILFSVKMSFLIQMMQSDHFLDWTNSFKAFQTIEIKFKKFYLFCLAFHHEIPKSKAKPRRMPSPENAATYLTTILDVNLTVTCVVKLINPANSNPNVIVLATKTNAEIPTRILIQIFIFITCFAKTEPKTAFFNLLASKSTYFQATISSSSNLMINIVSFCFRKSQPTLSSKKLNCVDIIFSFSSVILPFSSLTLFLTLSQSNCYSQSLASMI